MLDKKIIIERIEDLSKQLSIFYGRIIVVKIHVNADTSNANTEIEIKKM